MTILVSTTPVVSDALDLEPSTLHSVVEEYKPDDDRLAFYGLSSGEATAAVESDNATTSQDRGSADDAVDREEPALDFDTAAPFAGSAADLEGLNDDTKGAISDWLVSQSNKTFLDAKVHERMGEMRTFQAVAMLALDMALFPNRNWDLSLKERGINPANITSRHLAAKAVAAAFGLDQKADDPQTRERASHDIDRLSLPVEWLMKTVLAMTAEARRNITFDRRGIAALVQTIKDRGGLNAVAKIQRDCNNTPKAERELRIDINIEEGRKLLVLAGKQAIRADAGATDENEEIEAGVFTKVNGKTTYFTLESLGIKTLRDKLFATAAPVDPAVDTLGELLQIGKLVEERETSLPANSLDDPRAQSTKMRLATRHFVLRPDKSVMISPILSEEQGSPVVIARLKDFMVVPPAGALWVLETKGRRTAEANIADPTRRKFFRSSVGDHEGTQGVARLVITTEAADDEGKRTDDVGVLVQPLRSASGNLPLDVAANAFKAGFEFSLTATMLRAMDKDLPTKPKAVVKTSVKAKSSKTKPSGAKLSISGEAGKIELGAKTIVFDLQSPTKDGAIRLRSEHLLAIVHTLAELPLTSHIGVAVDPTGGMRMTLSTKLADYEVYVPALMKDSDQPSNRYFKTIEVK